MSSLNVMFSRLSCLSPLSRLSRLSCLSSRSCLYRLSSLSSKPYVNESVLYVDKERLGQLKSCYLHKIGMNSWFISTCIFLKTWVICLICHNQWHLSFFKSKMKIVLFLLLTIETCPEKAFMWGHMERSLQGVSKNLGTLKVCVK